jgi:hypothetical protein
MKTQKRLPLVLTFIALLVFSLTSRAALFDYSSSVGSGIYFDGLGNFTLNPTVNNFKITSGSAAGLFGEMTGTFAIGTITTADGASTAPVSGTGTLVIHDGVNDFTATLVWLDITQIGVGDFLNTSGTVNLTSIVYGGSNPDLVALKAAGSAINDFSFQFVPSVALSDLKTGAYATSFSGTMSANPAPPQPSLDLVKTASPINAVPGQQVTYSYAVTNTGTVPIANINIVDDNGTPGDTTDDFIVNATPFSLNPGQGIVFTLPHISEPICVSSSGSEFFAGTLTVNVLPGGDVEVFYMQSEAENDNRYGTGATAATGWVSHTHKFSDLVNSDEATFLFTDGNGKQVLEFQADYISATTSTKFGDGVPISYPSGYGTLGPLGGDGKMLIGNSSNVLSVTTTFSDTLNQSPTFYSFKTNSPPETSPLSDVSIPPGWNYVNGYHVIVSHNAFGAAGFGRVTVPLVHNSPSKAIDQIIVSNVCACVVNTATAFAVQGTTIIASDTDSAQVCFAPQSAGSTACKLTVGAVKFGAGGLTLPIKNSGSTTVFMNDLELSWPQTVNGNLIQVKLNGAAAVWKGSVITPTTLTTTDFDATSIQKTQRSIPPGKTMNLQLQFQHAPNTTALNYSGIVKFGTDPSCAISFP